MGVSLKQGVVEEINTGLMIVIFLLGRMPVFRNVKRYRWGEEDWFGNFFFPPFLSNSKFFTFVKL